MLNSVLHVVVTVGLINVVFVPFMGVVFVFLVDKLYFSVTISWLSYHSENMFGKMRKEALGFLIK